MSSQDVTKPVHTALSDDAEDARLAGHTEELFIGHKIVQVNPLYGTYNAGFEDMDVRGEDLAERHHTVTLCSFLVTVVTEENQQ